MTSRRVGFGTDGALELLLARLGSICWTRAKTVILVWLAAALVAGLFAAKISDRLLSGSGEIAGSASLRVDQALRTHFPRNDAQSLILTFRSGSLEKDPTELAALLRRLEHHLASHAAVSNTRGERELSNLGLTPRAASGHFIVIELRTKDVLATEQEVSKIRAALTPILNASRARNPDLEWAITGRAALTYDINQFNAQDSTRSEARALPLTLAILVFAFGSVFSAMLPLVLAIITRTVALGIVFFVAGPVDVSNLVLSIVTMLAIALGIDYSLFLIHRYRDERVRIARETPGGSAATEELAMCSAMAQSGTAILYSAATVAIGMGALIATPLMQTRSIGLGGLVAVLIALLASLTLVPALLRLLGTSLLEWPRFVSRRVNGERSRRLWGEWAQIIIRRPVSAIAISLAIVVALSASAVQTRFGFPEGEFLPAELEYSRGMDMLENMKLKGLVSPIVVLVRDTNNESALNPERVPRLARFVSRLEQDPRVRAVVGPVQSGSVFPGGQPGTIEKAMSGALFRSAFISDDRSLLHFQIIPSDHSTLAGLQDLAATIPAWLKIEGLVAEVGGQAQYYNDFESAVAQSYPLTIGLVLGMTAAALLLFFQAPLVAAKAILLNLLSVAAGYGVVVLVFQLGHGATLFGLSAGTGVIPITVPLVIFCIIFGLSMDYEIFLLSRVRAIFMESGDAGRSIREALADTGSVITSAALVMVAVFGAFAFARMAIVQMIGLGLAVAVLVDATLIRSALGPAIMQLAGRWNWWPVHRA